MNKYIYCFLGIIWYFSAMNASAKILKCKEQIADSFFQMQSMQNIKKYSSIYALKIMKKNGNKLSKNMKLLIKKQGFESTKIFCKYGLGFVEGNSLIGNEVYFTVVTFINEGGIWKFISIKFNFGDQSLKNYLSFPKISKALKDIIE